MNTKNGKITWTTEQRRLVDLREWDKNPRQLSEHDARHIKQSMDTFGLADPLIINLDNSLIGGHQRKHILADPDAIIDVRVPSRQLTEREAEELAIRLNKNTGQWDWDALANGFEFDDLIDWGFTEKELIGLDFGSEPAEDPGAQIDRAEELREKWGVESGQLWQFGEHRLICGDCTDPQVVVRVMQGEKAQLIFTSPPYWVGKDYEEQTTIKEIKDFIYASACSMAEAANRDGGRIVINCSTASARAINPKADAETIFTLAWWQEAMRQKDWLMRHCRIWLKGGDMAAKSVAARSDVIDQHWETIPEFLPTFYYPDGLRRGQEKIGVKWTQLGVWSDIPGERSAGGVHCAAFPLELPERYVRLYTTIGEIIFDPFLGSGTTLIACERLGRKCRAIEISPAYCAVAIQRWVDMTGGEPVLLYNGNQHG